MNVFVYGTLMKGYWNHRLLEREKFIGEGKIQNYGLYNVTSPYPGVIQKNGASVLGEIYDVSEKTLKKLDELEGEGTLYIRRAVNVETSEGVLEAYTYLWNKTVNEKDYVDVKDLPWRQHK